MRFPRRTLAMVVLTLVGLVLLDLQLRQGYPPRGQGIFVEHPMRFWALRPNTAMLVEGRLVKVGPEGFRGQLPDEREPGEVRVLLLGDSCTFGHGVAQNETLDRLLEKDLRQRTGRKVRVFNGGVPGYSTFQGLDLVRELAARIHPDLLVEAYFYADHSLDRVADHERLPPPPFHEVRRLLWSSGIYRMLRAKLVEEPADSIDLAEDRRMPRDGTVLRVPPERTRANLVEIARRSGARHALFLLLPSRVPMAGPDDPHPKAVEAAAGESPGGRFLDLRDAWRGGPDGLFMDDIHPTRQGFQALAELLAPVLAPWVEEVP